MNIVNHLLQKRRESQANPAGRRELRGGSPAAAGLPGVFFDSFFGNGSPASLPAKPEHKAISSVINRLHN